MKILLSYLFICLMPLKLLAQDDEPKCSLTAGVEFNSIAIIDPSSADSTGNSLSIAPYLKFQLHSGIGIKAQTFILSSGLQPGYYMTALSPFYSVDNKKVALDVSYTHFFISDNRSIWYTPITNEIYASYTSKKPIISPTGGVDLGFGTDTTTKKNSFAYDVNLFLGVAHTFDWELCDSNISINFTPRILFNAGTDSYFEFLKSTGFITHNKNFESVVKNKVHENGKKRNGTANPTTSSFALSNLELAEDLNFSVGNFAFEPEGSLFIPFGAGQSAFGYMQIGVSYQFK